VKEKADLLAALAAVGLAASVRDDLCCTSSTRYSVHPSVVIAQADQLIAKADDARTKEQLKTVTVGCLSAASTRAATACLPLAFVIYANTTMFAMRSTRIERPKPAPSELLGSSSICRLEWRLCLDPTGST